MTKTKPFSRLSGPIERVEEYEQTMETILALGELRTRRQVTQQELAQELHGSHANISKIERKDDL
jgi:transcriptional regulator